MCFHYTASQAVRWVRERRSVTSVDGDNYLLLLHLQKEIEDAFESADSRASGRTRDWRPAPDTEAEPPSDDEVEADPECARAPSPPRDEPPRAVLTPAKPTPQDLESAAPGIYDVLPVDKEEEGEDAMAEHDRKWASVRITSTDYTEEDRDAAAALSEEENAAPRPLQRLACPTERPRAAWPS